MRLGFIIASSARKIAFMSWKDVSTNRCYNHSRLRRWVYLRDLLRELIAREMKVRYKRSVLGIVWSLINPLMHLLVFSFLFRVILSLNIPRYSSFAFSGLLAWNWFQTSLVQAANIITGNRELIRRPGFPATILPVVTVITNLIHFLMALPILMLFLAIEGSGLNFYLFVLPVVIAIQFILTLGLAYFVAGVNVIFRDTQHLLIVLLQLFFFLTPILYDSRLVPIPYQSLYRLNPMVHLVEAYRTILIRGRQPDWLSLLELTLIALGILLTSYRVFVGVRYRFIEEL